MHAKLSTPMLALFLLCALVSHASAGAPQSGAEAARAAKVRAEVARRGVGEKARVKVRLRDRKELKGYISRAGEESFTVTDPGTGQASTFAYGEVERVRGRGGMPRAAWAAVGVGVGLAVLVVGLRAGGPVTFGP